MNILTRQINVIIAFIADAFCDNINIFLERYVSVYYCLTTDLEGISPSSTILC
jgi:hypothetical protein